MASEPPPLVQKVQTHLEEVEADPSMPLDVKTLEECEYLVVPRVDDHPLLRDRLVSQISGVLPRLQQDPNPLIRLLSQLSEPYPFEKVLSMQPPVDFVAGLSPDAEPYNLLMINLLRKAGDSPSETSHLASMPMVVRSLVMLWLQSPEIGIADAAGTTLLQLLETDQEATSVAVHGIGDAAAGSHKPSGTGLLWRRVFGDKDIYSLLFMTFDRGRDPAGSSMSTKQRSLAQARLLAFAPKLGSMDWSYLTRSHQPEIEASFGLNSSKEGLLDFIAVYMVDYKEDVLLHINLIQFYAQLLSRCQMPSQHKRASVALDFLKNRGLHNRTIAYWLKPEEPSHDPLDITFLYGPSAQYLSAYASLFPGSLLQDDTADQAVDGLYRMLQRLSSTFSISANQWSQGQYLKHDLSVLVCMPRVALLPQTRLGTGRQSSPLLLVPCKNTNADALDPLARVFHGPMKALQIPSTPLEVVTSAEETTDPEASAARALYTVYLSYHSDLYTDLVRHANTIALPNKAIAAINFITSIATANWSPLPTLNSYHTTTLPKTIASLPSESTLAAMLPTNSTTSEPTAPTGIGALLQHPVREVVFPFLLRPPQTFTNLVGGRGDPESSAYRVAMAKWDCLCAVQKELRKLVTSGEGGADAGAVMDAVDARAREGVWGPASEAGGRIATLDM